MSKIDSIGLVGPYSFWIWVRSIEDMPGLTKYIPSTNEAYLISEGHKGFIYDIELLPFVGGNGGPIDGYYTNHGVNMFIEVSTMESDIRDNKINCLLDGERL